MDNESNECIDLRTVVSGLSHSFDTGVAAYFKSTTVAVVFSHIMFWISRNKNKEGSQHDGHVWMYSSVEELSYDLPYLTKKQIRYSIDLLVQAGFLVKGNFNKNRFDRKCWYRLGNDSILSNQRFNHRETNLANQKCQISHMRTDKFGSCTYVEDIEKDLNKRERGNSLSQKNDFTPPHEEDKAPEIEVNDPPCCPDDSKYFKVTQEEYDQLVETYGQEVVDDVIEDIDLHCSQKGRYRDYLSAFKKFIKFRKKDEEDRKKGTRFSNDRRRPKMDPEAFARGMEAFNRMEQF